MLRIQAVRDPHDELLDRMDLRVLYAVMRANDDDGLRAEAARRLARRRPHQRAPLLAALALDDDDALDDPRSVDVALDDFDGLEVPGGDRGVSA